MIGLARRAGAVVTGVSAVREALRAGRAHLVLTAEDASVSQLAKVERLMVHRGVRSQRVGSRVSLGIAVGCGPLTTVAVTDQRFADYIVRGFELREGLEGTDPDRNRSGRALGRDDQ